MIAIAAAKVCMFVCMLTANAIQQSACASSAALRLHEPLAQALQLCADRWQNVVDRSCHKLMARTLLSTIAHCTIAGRLFRFVYTLMCCTRVIGLNQVLLMPRETFPLAALLHLLIQFLAFVTNRTSNNRPLTLSALYGIIFSMGGCIPGFWNTIPGHPDT